MEWNDQSPDLGELRAFISRQLAACGKGPLVPEEQEEQYVRGRLAEIDEQVRMYHLWPAARGEIDMFALQQAQWEATAYAEATAILERAHRMAADIVREAHEAAKALEPAPSDNRPYEGRHHVVGDRSIGPFAARLYIGGTGGQTASLESPTQLLPVVCGRARVLKATEDVPAADMSANRNSAATRPALLPNSWLGTLDELRPRLWATVRTWFSDRDEPTACRLTAKTFDWAVGNIYSLPSRPEEVETWLRKGAEHVEKHWNGSTTKESKPGSPSLAERASEPFRAAEETRYELVGA
jgi:hypothetical protein